MKPFYEAGGITLYHGDALETLRALPDGAAQMCVTSPPYWGLRDYGTAQWDGGDAECGHEKDRSVGIASSGLEGGKGTTSHQREASYRDMCGKCGARRIDRQLGLEATPEEYVANMVAVFREVRRVLRDDGTLWLNIGDSYNAYNGNRGTESRYAGNRTAMEPAFPSGRGLMTPELKPKDLVGIPWRLAFALQADGWYLRSDIIWAKPNPMPESVTDRPTKAHEYLFLMAKRATYYYDADAIREAAEWARWGDQTIGKEYRGINPGDMDTLDEKRANGRNKRTVWTIATEPYPEAHFATFPTALVTPCILAGCPEGGKQCDCNTLIYTPTGEGDRDVDPTLLLGRAGMNRPRRAGEGSRPISRREQRSYAEQMKTSPYRDDMATIAGPAFAHYIRSDTSGARPLPPALLADFRERGWLVEPEPCPHPYEAPGVVLDPFAGSGTTLQVAKQLGRKAIGIELNADYLPLIEDRLNRIPIPMPLFSEPPAEKPQQLMWQGPAGAEWMHTVGAGPLDVAE